MDGRGRVAAYIALGANLGAAEAALGAAVQAIGQLPLTRILQASELYRSTPLDTDSGVAAPAAGGDYLNAVVAVETGLTAPDLMAQLQQLENRADRERPYRNAPRTLDLDLLLFGSGQIDSPHLTVPHPRMWLRAFVLVPLADIAPGLVSPVQLQRVAGQAIERVGPLRL